MCSTADRPAIVDMLEDRDKATCQNFSVMQTRLTDMLKATALQPEDIQSLLRLRASASPLDSSNLRIDLAPYNHVHWLNDLEKVTEDCKKSLDCLGIISNVSSSIKLLALLHSAENDHACSMGLYGHASLYVIALRLHLKCM